MAAAVRPVARLAAAMRPVASAEGAVRNVAPAWGAPGPLHAPGRARSMACTYRAPCVAWRDRDHRPPPTWAAGAGRWARPPPRSQRDACSDPRRPVPRALDSRRQMGAAHSDASLDAPTLARAAGKSGPPGCGAPRRPSLATQTAPRDRRPPSPHRTLPCAVRGDRSAPARPRSRHTAARHLLALPDRSLPQPRPIVSTDMEVSSTKSITRIQNPGRGLDGMAMLERERGLGRSVNSGVWGVIQAKARLLAGPAEARGGDAGMALGLAGVRWTSAALVAAAARSHHLVADTACGRAQSGCREHPASSSRPATRRRLSPQSTRVTCVGGAPWAAPPTPMPA